MTQTRHIPISVLLVKEGEGWVAQCLEYDIVGQGGSIREAQDSFIRVVQGQLYIDSQRGREPFQGIEPAPPFYWAYFREGARMHDPLTVPPPAVSSSHVFYPRADDVRVY